jgi:drug/metabolite transporter (DMT)-like permease
VAMSSFIKLAGEAPAGQIVFFRSFFAMIPILAVLAWRRELGTAFHTVRPFSHIIRGLVGVSGMACGFFALTRLPLPEWLAINYAQPLIVVAIGALLLGETVRVYRWSAVAAGLVGVLIIIWPKLTVFAGDSPVGREAALGVLACLAAALISALAVILVRRLVWTEKTPTIVLWFSLTATAASLLTIPFGWEWLSPATAAVLVAAGFCGGLGQILMTEGYRHADLSTVAPFEYTSMVLGVAVGFAVFGDVPSLSMLIGGAIVVASGLFIIWREQRLGLERGKARSVTPPQG